MKNFLRPGGSLIITLGIAIMAAGCGEKEVTERRAEAPVNGTEVENGETAAVEEPNVQGDPASVELEDEMIGYWAPDVDATKKTLDETMKDKPDELAAAKALVEPILSSMALQIPAKGRIVMYFMGVPQPSTYTVLSVDSKARTLGVEMTENGNGQRGEITIDDDQMTLSKDGETLILDRIDEATFKKRQKVPSSAPAVPGLPGSQEDESSEPAQPPRAE